MDFETLNWPVLERLRAGFLNGSSVHEPYWRSMEDLEQYDLTFGERIGWKWDAVLRELALRRWTPPTGKSKDATNSENDRLLPAHRVSVLDWGCGSGIAGRRVLAFLGAENVSAFSVWDHSPLARQFALKKAAADFPNLNVAEARADEDADILIISHVINELDREARDELMSVARRSQIVLWVEPGTHAVSRELIAVREALRGEFEIVAPCTHREACGLLAIENARHWCHGFAPPPPEIYADSDWVKFGHRAGIDLRSLPYSFLVLQKAAPQTGTISQRPAAESGQTVERIIGDPRHYKGYVKVLSSGPLGVRELMLQKRDDPARYKSLKRETGVPIYRWTLEGERIQGSERVYEKEVLPAEGEASASDA